MPAATLTLNDGARLHVRALEPGDSTLIEEAVEHLSPRSRYRRFLAPIDHLSARQLTYLTTVDHDHHEALVAIDPATGDAVAVARYVATDGDPSTAEIAVTVDDRWQGRGLGTALLRRLAQRAGEHGIRRFTGLILSENTPMLKLMAALGPVISRTDRRGTVELVVGLREDLE